MMTPEELYGEDGVRINVGMSTCGLAAGANPVYNAFIEASSKLGVKAKVVNVGCIGACFAEPLVEIMSINKSGVLYSNVNPDNAEKILSEYLRGKIEDA